VWIRARGLNLWTGSCRWRLRFVAVPTTRLRPNCEVVPDQGRNRTVAATEDVRPRQRRDADTPRRRHTRSNDELVIERSSRCIREEAAIRVRF
jgi:hypothetical protein